MVFGMWYVISWGIVELKQLYFCEFRGFQPGVHRVGPGMLAQVACQDAEALNGALVGGDDGSGDFKIIEER